MRELKTLLNQVSGHTVHGKDNALISEITFDSRKATGGVLFIAIKGVQTDGHAYVLNAYDLGCRVAVVESIIEVPEDMTLVKVEDSSVALAELSCAWFDNPSNKLKLVGITGTNGKTTTATLLYDMFTYLGFTSGLISTVVNKIGSKEIVATHTTPDPIALNHLLNEMVQSGCEYAFMEVSSHAIHQKRIHGINFCGGVFTNITHDHLDYHHSFSEYLQVKKEFFDNLSADAFGLVNLDDRNGMVMLQNCKAKKSTYSLQKIADFKGIILENELTGLVLKINNKDVYTQLIGKFNALNLLAVFGVSQLLGIPETESLVALSQLKSVEGRFQFFKTDGDITVVVDYAHTPDALENVLNTISAFQKDNSKVVTIVGCGGDRDKDKRPQMAKIAQKLSNQVILTSDNPRTENPEIILQEMLAGIDAESLVPVLSIVDRKQAILTGAVISNPNDIVLIAGKGHEKYQDINGVKHSFDDMEIAVSIFKQLKK